MLPFALLNAALALDAGGGAAVALSLDTLSLDDGYVAAPAAQVTQEAHSWDPDHTSGLSAAGAAAVLEAVDLVCYENGSPLGS